MTQDETLAMLHKVVAENQQYTTWTVSTPHLVALVNQAIKSERDAIAVMIEDAPALVEFACNDQGGCLMCGFTPKIAAKIIRARGEALAQPTSGDYALGYAEGFNDACKKPEQEPVAWGVFDHNLHDMFFAKEEAHEMARLKGDGSTVKPLYTTPPQRTWVGLTEGEVMECLDQVYGVNVRFGAFAEVIEAKLKEKNT